MYLIITAVTVLLLLVLLLLCCCGDIEFDKDTDTLRKELDTLIIKLLYLVERYDYPFMPSMKDRIYYVQLLQTEIPNLVGNIRDEDWHSDQSSINSDSEDDSNSVSDDDNTDGCLYNLFNNIKLNKLQSIVRDNDVLVAVNYFKGVDCTYTMKKKYIVAMIAYLCQNYSVAINKLPLTIVNEIESTPIYIDNIITWSKRLQSTATI